MLLTPFRLGVVFTMLASSAIAAPAQGPDDPFQPYVDARPPRVLREIPVEGIPVPEGVTVRGLVFESVAVNAPDGPRVNEVYAVIAKPTAPGVYPGLALLHGGAGHADPAWAMAWAKRGYAAIVMDLPGIAEPKAAVHSAGLWRERAYASDRFVVRPDFTACSIFQAEVAALQAFHLLGSDPAVDKARIGVAGVSWGGYSTVMVAGLLGGQVKAAFSVYGCGHYENCVFQGGLKPMTPEDHALWTKYLDAGERAKNIKGTFFLASASNDTYFWPPAVRDTLAEIPGGKNLLIAPNADHQLPVPGGNTVAGVVPAMEMSFFDYLLKGEGAPLPAVHLQPGKAGEPAKVSFTVDSPRPPNAAAVWYAPVGEHWKHRKWTALPATLVGGTYTAELPADFLASGGDYFALVSDDRPVTVSSGMTHLEPAAR